MTEETAIIIGAGPAGLTAALEILRQRPMKVVVLEASGDIGGISKTVNHNGNRIDIGGHRFFSKSDWVMDWWRDILPVEAEGADAALEIAYQNKRRTIDVSANDQATPDDARMLVRNRLSRIYFNGNFFSYPLKADVETAMKLGPMRVGRMIGSYAAARAFPRAPEDTLEDFLINRFGNNLYQTFFREYTEKVWGVPCNKIGADWGAQRIKGLSIRRALVHAIKSKFGSSGDGLGGAAETSLIERFLYPKFGPGQMWETAADEVRKLGGTIMMNHKAVALAHDGGRIKAVTAASTANGLTETIPADHVVSTMPVVDLVEALRPGVPQAVARVSNGLQYRDFMTVGLLLRRLEKTAGAIPGSPTNLVPDNWIYIQEPGVRVGRLQFFNNWSPYMVQDPNTVWVGMEYFCSEGDDLWTMPESDAVSLGIAELQKIGFARPENLMDSVVIRVPKAYPGYYGSYNEFATIRSYTDTIANLYLVGRNGMHRYNNQDHSMLTARYAVESIIQGKTDKSAIWDVNVDDDYHEEDGAKKPQTATAPTQGQRKAA